MIKIQADHDQHRGCPLVAEDHYPARRLSQDVGVPAAYAPPGPGPECSGLAQEVVVSEVSVTVVVTATEADLLLRRLRRLPAVISAEKKCTNDGRSLD